MSTEIVDTDASLAPYQLRPPSEPLSRFVEVFWYWRGHPLPAATERVLPMGTVELVIDLANPHPAGGGIAGPQSESFLIERTDQDELVGVHFRPGGLYPFVACPLGDLQNQNVTLDDLWGAEAAERLIESLHAAVGPQGKMRTLEKWLVRMAPRPLSHHRAIDFALAMFERDSSPSSSVRLAERVQLSQGRLIRLFRDEVGLTPKLFARVLRFNRVVEAIHSQEDVDWLEVALSFGYFDQSHFNHDFREFCQLTPTQYLQHRIPDQFGHLEVPG